MIEKGIKNSSREAESSVGANRIERNERCPEDIDEFVNYMRGRRRGILRDISKEMLEVTSIRSGLGYYIPAE